MQQHGHLQRVSEGTGGECAVANVAHSQLQPSGGWLGEVVIVVSDLLGVWDIFVLSVIFILSWVLIRTSWMETSICFGLVFDLGIPLQYVCEYAPEALPPAPGHQDWADVSSRR